MITRRLAARRLVRRGSTAEQPLRRSAARAIAVAVMCGAAAGSVAWLEAWPFARTQTIVRDALGSGGPNEVSAQAIFLPAEPKHMTIDVYRTPPPPPPRAAPTAPNSSSSGEHETETGEGGTEDGDR